MLNKKSLYKKFNLNRVLLLKGWMVYSYQQGMSGVKWQSLRAKLANSSWTARGSQLRRRRNAAAARRGWQQGFQARGLPVNPDPKLL